MHVYTGPDQTGAVPNGTGPASVYMESFETAPDIYASPRKGQVQF